MLPAPAPDPHAVRGNGTAVNSVNSFPFITPTDGGTKCNTHDARKLIILPMPNELNGLLATMHMGPNVGQDDVLPIHSTHDVLYQHVCPRWIHRRVPVPGM